MNEVLAVSYTGDILAHRRCPRAWAYSKQAGFQSYEQAQALEGRLIHHSMEWLVDKFHESGTVPSIDSMRSQLEYRFSVLWARGLKTAFSSKEETVKRVLENLYPDRVIHPTVRVAIEGASHTEYELRAVRKIIPGNFYGKEKLMLTGILDLVLHQKSGFEFRRVWQWTDIPKLIGESVNEMILAKEGDLEVWDYKGTRSDGPYERDYVLQLLTYARLYQERTGVLPVRCVLFFLNEVQRADQLLVIPINHEVIEAAEQWTIHQAMLLRQTAICFQENPSAILGGSLELVNGTKIDPVLKKQCTACGQRFDCQEYISALGHLNHPDVDIRNVGKN